MTVQVRRIRKTNDGNKLICRPDASKLLPVYRRLAKAITTYVINMGGGGSSKSYSQAQDIVKRCLRKKEKVLVIRKTATTLNDSVIDQFQEIALPFWGLREGEDWTYNATKRSLTFTVTGSRIIFRGLDNPEKMKSISGVTIVWVEEATEISESEFNVLSDRIRGEPQIFITFNPVSERHWLKRRFFDPAGVDLDPTGKTTGFFKQVDHRTTLIFSTFKENPYVGTKYIEDMEWYKQNNPDHYRIYGLGLWGIVRPEMPYFWAWKSTRHLDHLHYEPHRMEVYLSWDFNVNNSCLVSQRESGEWVNYLELIHGGGDLAQICERIVTTYGQMVSYRFTGDASGNNQSATTEGNAAAWDLIRGHFRTLGVPEGFCDYSLVPQANTSTAVSRTVANAVLTMYGSNLKVNKDGCGLLLDDLDRMQALANGSLNKTDCNKYNYGHAGDAFRYDLQNFDGPTFKARFGETLLKNVSLSNQRNINHYRNE
jgi:phage terminase large subunit